MQIQNEIVCDIERLRYAAAWCDINTLGQLLAEIKVKYNMDDAIRLNAALNNAPVNMVSLATSSYSEHRELTSQYISILENRLVLTWTNYYSFSNKTANFIYSNSQNFECNQVLHKSRGCELKVSDILAVIGYAKDVYETAGGVVNDRISMGLMALNSIDLALNNKKPDKPINKLLHLAVDALAEIAKKLADNKQTGQAISGISLLTNLTIDFFVKE